MKQWISIPLLAAAVGMQACKTTDDSYQPQMAAMRDSIFKDYPTVAAITINVQNREMLFVTLGDPQLYAASQTDKQKMTNDLGTMTLRIFGKDNALHSLRMIVTKDTRNEQTEPADGISATVSLDSLRKVLP